jgi:hypothetical protein
MLAAVLAEREGKPADDMASRVIAGALVGMMLALVPPGSTGVDRSDFDRMEEGVRLLREAFGRGRD